MLKLFAIAHPEHWLPLFTLRRRLGQDRDAGAARRSRPVDRGQVTRPHARRDQRPPAPDPRPAARRTIPGVRRSSPTGSCAARTRRSCPTRMRSATRPGDLLIEEAFLREIKGAARGEEAGHLLRAARHRQDLPRAALRARPCSPTRPSATSSSSTRAAATRTSSRASARRSTTRGRWSTSCARVRWRCSPRRPRPTP